MSFGTESTRELDLIYGYVLSLGEYAFAGCSALESIAFPEIFTVDPENAIDTIGAYAFKDCISLASVSFETGELTGEIRIGEGAFSGCSKLENITLPEVTTQIGAGAFKGCTTLSEIVIPESVVTIGAGAFSEWESTQKISVKGKAEASGGWAEDWKENCFAQIDWNA